jgi:hypothetical protein
MLPEPIAVTLAVVEEQRPLDMAYLRHWADALDVPELLERALAEAGLLVDKSSA